MPSASQLGLGGRKSSSNRQRHSVPHATAVGCHQSSDFADFASRSIRSASAVSPSSSSGSLRLADVAKQLGMGVHVENWREDTKLVQQHLPMQHIIGSLKRDRDEATSFKTFDNIPMWDDIKIPARSETSAQSPLTDDTFLQLLRSPKRRRCSWDSKADSPYTTCSDPDRRFSYQSPEHVPKEISQAALPGLNHVLNLSTITAEERDIFSEYAPKDLEDPHVLMNEVLNLRKVMVEGDELSEDAVAEDEDGVHRDLIPADRDAEVRKALEEFIDFSDTRRWIAKI